MYLTVYAAINGKQESDAVAIEGVGRAQLTYRGLRSQVEHAIDTLNSLGYGMGDRLAVVLPDGPETAVALLSVTSGFTCAPLNPNYSEQELQFFLSDIRADAVLVQAGIDTPAMAVARSLGIPCISLTPDADRAGVFELAGTPRGARHEKANALSDDIALLLHTSGTTSRPKLVPLLQSGIVTSARNIVDSLSLTDRDRCLNVMPLFHVHGLIGALLSTVVSGGSTICTQGFRSPDFLDWTASYHPTWYTAVPTIHQKVLEQATAQPARARLSGLRFIRSASSPLPPVVAAGLESAFAVPVIEAYGMTEASHQIAANPLPPLPRKAGSVGRGTGVEIAILDDRGECLPRGCQGQIALKGSSIIPGYENNPDANAKAYVNGWFLTGDLGHLDEDSYLYIDARIKEVINRGGEKVSPREVEEVLLSHPAVSEAAVFSIPDAKLGENVGAAVVLKPGEKIAAEDLKRFVSGHLAYFKVPARLWPVSEIPKGPTGKVQRIGLCGRLGLPAGPAGAPGAAGHEPPATPVEKTLKDIWAEVLGKDDIGRLDSFFDLGGDSLQATMVISRINQAFGVTLTIARVMNCDTIAELGNIVETMALQAGNGGAR